MSGKTPGKGGGPGRGTGKPTPGGATAKTSARGASNSSQGAPRGAGPASGSRAMVPRGSRAVAAPRTVTGTQERSLIAPEGYTMRKIEPAKNYDVISFARAMNPDMGPRVKELFDPERQAALDAQRSGIYVGWRCPDFNHDCQRVNSGSKCFCGHLLNQHDKYTARSVRVPCKHPGCKCKAYAWIPARPEEIGEFWFKRRRDFDPQAWRAKCRCKHTHEEHDPTGLRRCLKCGCGAFDSPFLCAACDRHWEMHETVFEGVDDRVQKGLPVGADYLPFAEIPSLRNMVLTGEDDGDMSYMKIMDENIQFALPPSTNQRAIGNDDPFPGGSGRGGGGQGRSGGGGTGGGPRGGFKPVYD